MVEPSEQAAANNSTTLAAAPSSSSSSYHVHPTTSRRRSGGGGGGGAAGGPSDEESAGSQPLPSRQRPYISRDPLKDGPVRKPEDSFRDEIARQIFGDIGNIRDDYSCAVESKILLHGRMYITDKFICFYSNFFGFEKKIKIPFSHVLKITKGNTALLIPNGINVVTSRKEYCFRSFWDRDDCYFQMVQSYRTYCHMPSVSREAIIDSRSIDKDGVMESASTIAPATTPTNAATSAPSPAVGAAPPPSSAAQPQLQQQQQQQAPDSAAATTTTPTAAATPALAPQMFEEDVGKRAGLPPPSPSSSSSASATSTRATRASQEALKEEGGPVSDLQSVSSAYDEDDMLDFDDLREGTLNVVAEDLDVAFEKASHEQPLKEKGLDFRLRKINVQEFFEEFISDKARLGIDKYHESHGDKEIDVSPWQEVNQGVGATRSIRFVAQLDGLPVGPPTAPVLQLQRVRVFGQHGIILETSSSMENVPAADCFTVEDRWVISPLEHGGLLIRTSFEVRFVKSTFFKKIIESRSRTDTLSYHQKYFEMVDKHLARKFHEKVPRRAVKQPPPQIEKREVEEEPSLGDLLQTTLGVAGGILKRIKWDRFIIAILVFTCLFYLLRLFLYALMPSAVDLGVPHTHQFNDLIAELRALRMDVQDLKNEMRRMTERLGGLEGHK